MNKIIVQGDSMHWWDTPIDIPKGQANFSKIYFEFDSAWDGYDKIAQFIQGDVRLNVAINNNIAFCPAELNLGMAFIAIRGMDSARNTVIATANQVCIQIIPGFESGGTPPVPPTPDLYQELIAEFKRDIVKKVNGNLPDEEGNVEIEIPQRPPYLSLERLGSYLYEVTFGELPEETEDNPQISGGCSSYVLNGKLFRNLDFNYDDKASFHVICNGFEGMAFSPGLTDIDLDDSIIAKLPHRLMDGSNDYNIKVSTHVLYNDWDWQGDGETPLYKVPFMILSQLKSMDNIEEDLADLIADLKTYQALEDEDYLLQFLITDGTTTYALLPPEASTGSYVLVDISENPKLSNFRWVPDSTVSRENLQDRPTGVERWNMMPTELDQLRFTKAYEAPNRLSEFIGLRGTTKDSTDVELLVLYNEAHDLYVHRTRDGQTWQTMHSVVYSEKGLEMLCVQENWERNYMSAGGEGGETFDIHSLTTEDNIANVDELPFYDVSEGESRKTTWSNIKSKLKSYFDSVYLGINALAGYATQAWVVAQDFASKAFVNSTVGTNTAYYISNNGQPFTSVEQLLAYTGTITNNDYAFVVGQDSEGNTTYTRYKYNSGTQQWAVEYVLNNSSFTAAQWAAISSGITSGDVVKIAQIEAALGDKVDKVTGKGLSTNDYTDMDKAKVDAALTETEIFFAEYGVTTFDSIAQAVEDGKKVQVKRVADNGTYIYDLTLFSSTAIRFGQITNSSLLYCSLNSSEVWSYGSIAYVDIARMADIPTKTSELENDSGFLDEEDVEEYEGIEAIDVETISIDTTVTSGSSNLITSGAVYNYIASLDGNEVEY